MESVQFRINGGALEYRSLIIQAHNNGWPSEYTDWKLVPNVENDEQKGIVMAEDTEVILILD